MHLTRYLCVLTVSLGLTFVPLGPARAQDAFVGSWVLDTAASTGPPGMTPSAGTVDVKDAGGGRFTSVSEVTMSGVVGRSEITFAVDGKDYPVTMTPATPGSPPITQSTEQVSATVYKISIKAGGQEMMTATVEVSDDSKTLTQTATGVGQLAGLTTKSVFRRQ
jgi:hypothetical protein